MEETMVAWSGLFDNEFSDGPHSLQVDISPLRRKATRVLKRKSLADLNELMLTLNGIVDGSTALAQHDRVTAVQGLGGVDLGGVRAIETVDIINRASVPADEVVTVAMLTETRAPSTYPTDASGNGGGGKAGV